MDIIDFIINTFESTTALIGFFFKSFSIVLTAIFLLYSLVLLNQTGVMTKVLILKNKQIYKIISMVQVIFAFILLVLAIVLI